MLAMGHHTQHGLGALCQSTALGLVGGCGSPRSGTPVPVPVQALGSSPHLGKQCRISCGGMGSSLLGPGNHCPENLS